MNGAASGPMRGDRSALCAIAGRDRPICRVDTRLHRSHARTAFGRLAPEAGAVDHQVNRAGNVASAAAPLLIPYRQRVGKPPPSRVCGRHDTKRDRRIAWKGCAALN